MRGITLNLRASEKVNFESKVDLVDVQAMKKDNDGYRFLLTVIDVEICLGGAFVRQDGEKSGRCLRYHFQEGQ